MGEYIKRPAKVFTELIKKNWSLRMGNEPEVVYLRDKYMMNVRVGGIYVYQTHVTPRINTVDYRTHEVNSYVSFRVTNPDPDRHDEWLDELMRILMTFRRAGPKVLDGYSYYEVVSQNDTNDISGYYTTTIDIKLTTYAQPIHESGFGVDCHGVEIGPYWPHIPPGHERYNGHWTNKRHFEP